MKPRMAAAVAAVLVSATGPLSAPVFAHAEPAVPQTNTQCSKHVAGALTQLPDLKTFLECRDQPGIGYRWQKFDNPYPNSDRLLTYGPVITLHGEGQRNREIDSGDWIAYPQESGSRCKAEQLDNARAGTPGQPQVSTTGEPGQPLKLRVLPLLFTVELSGYCLWQKVQ